MASIYEVSISGLERILHSNSYRSARVAFATALVVGLLCHLYGFVNLFPSHDYLDALYYNESEYIHKISLGRLCAPLYTLSTASQATMPWSAGFFGVVFLSFAAAMIANEFKLAPISSIALSAVVVSNRTVTATVATYMHDFGAYSFAFLTATISFVLWIAATRREKINMAALAGGSICLSIAMAIYQATLSIPLVLIVLYSIWRLVVRRDNVSVVFSSGLWAAGMVLMSGLLYFLLYKLVLFAFKINPADAYNSLSAASRNGEGLLDRIVGCYREVISILFGSKVASAYPVVFVKGANALLFVLTVLGLLRSTVGATPLDKKAAILTCALLIVLPLFANISRALTVETHDLMYFGVWLMVLLPLVLFFKNKSEACFADKGIAVILLLLVSSNFQTANLSYQVKDMRYEGTQSLMTEIMYRVDALPEYSEGVTPVVFLGEIGNTLRDSPEAWRINKITGMDKWPISPNYTDIPFVGYVLGRNVNVRHSSSGEWTNLVGDRGSFPASDSIWMEDGVAYVNLGVQAKNSV